MKNAGLILMVDDDNDLRNMYSDCLRHAGYEVLEAANGHQGIEQARKHYPDLVLLDVGLPDMSGVEVCRQIKSDPNLTDVFVAFCSGEATSDDHKVNGFHTGADEYLVKPIGIPELVARVQTLIRLRNTTTALRASREHHRRLIDILPDAVCLIHPDGRLLAVNSQAVSMLGYATPDDLLGKTVFEFAPAEEHDRIKADIVATLKAGMARNVEYPMLRKDGTRLNVEMSATVSLGVHQQPAGLLCVVRDITERKVVQKALAASEERFRQIAEHIQEVFWMSSPDKSQIIYVSPAYEKIWGQSCESLYASPMRWIQAIHPDDRKRIQASSHNHQLTGTYDELYRVVRPDGSIRWVQDRAFPITDASGNCHRIVGVADDITKRKQAWDALEESEARKRAIMEAALDGIVTIDQEGRMVELNVAAGKIFAHNRSKLVGQNIMEVIPEFLRPWFKDGLTRCFEGHPGPSLGSRIEMPALRSDGGQFYAEFTVTRIRLAGPPMFTLYIRDITQRKRTEVELRSLSQRIIKAQEDERSRIAKELHDGINQLVASVKMRLSKVQTSQLNLQPAAREILSRCDRLLVKVLEENRRIAHNLRPTDLDQLGLSAACGSLCREVQLRTNLKFKCDIPTPSPRLPSGVELNLFRIVQEAITNIEKYAAATSVKLQIRFQDHSLVLKIQDNGLGFDTETAQAKRKKRHGLGITNMRERALSLGGTCEISSTHGKGTTILVCVPLKATPKEAEPQLNIPPAQSPRRRRRPARA